MLNKPKDFQGLNITIHTNNNCTLKCKYCYENKSGSVFEDKLFWCKTGEDLKDFGYTFLNEENDCKVLSLDYAKSFLDKLLNEFPFTPFYEIYVKPVNPKNKLVIDFLGGDSLQYPELLDDILTYFVDKLQDSSNKWATDIKYKWRISISSNGVTLLNPNARKFCEKWKEVLSLGISIDGSPELHDLNRLCFADNKNGTPKGSWQYIEKVWPWYKKNFPENSLSTKWTVAPNSYNYIVKSVKFLHEKLGMKYLNFNRVMEQNVLDTPKQLWELIQQFQELCQYMIEKNTELYISPFDYAIISSTLSRQTLLETEPTWSRCGFGKMPALSLDGNVYPCFRLIPKHNHTDKIISQGTVFTSLAENLTDLIALNENAQVSKLKVDEKCKICSIFSSCPHCAADCVNNDLTLSKTTSVCNFHRTSVYFARLYWRTIKMIYPKKYRDIKITWTEEEENDLLDLILKEILI
jgi:uncharacterized protein